MLTKSWFISFAIFYSVMTIVNYYISVVAPNSELIEIHRKTEQAKRVANGDEPVRQDERMYADALAKTELASCPDVRDAENNVFYNCKDGEKISMTRWTRSGGDRKGIVTRWYDSQGKLKMIYGHPDDV